MENIAQSHHHSKIPHPFDLIEAPADPYAREIIKITKEEFIELKSSIGYWKNLSERRAKKIAGLERINELQQAKIRDLNQRLYGKKTEKGTKKPENTSSEDTSNKKPRGQQKKSKGHGRTHRPHLSIVDETRDLPEDKKTCPACHKPYKELSMTEDSQIIEIEVKAYKRIIHRKCYKSCRCQRGLPAIITAPKAARLIAKSQLGISVWVRIILDKYLHMIPTHRTCTQFGHIGAALSAGTITDGLRKMIPYFKPLLNRMLDKQMTEKLFQGDETGWKVFEGIPDKVGNKWWLWMIRSPSVIYFHISPSRSADMPINHFSNLPEESKSGKVILLCDRYSAYKRLSREFPFIILAFCWAHVRRDFLDSARRYPKLNVWMLNWVEEIGELYHINNLRLEHWDETKDVDQQSNQFKEYHEELTTRLKDMAKRRDEFLTKDEIEKDHKNKLHPQQRAVLNSLVTHWNGLIVFVDYPEVDMDNNGSERALRNPVTGRRNYYGSGSKWSAELAAILFTALQTILLWKLNPHTWLHYFLTACAHQGGPLTDLSEFLPWEMSDERKRLLSLPLSKDEKNSSKILDELETVNTS